jgi:hypothetical protein
MELVVDEAVGPLRWVAEQYAVRLDVLGRVLRRDRRRPRPVVARWRRAGLVEQGRVAPSADPMVWPTRAGLRAAGWRCPAKPPPLRLLAHLHAVSLVRLGIEAAGGAWTPERALYRERPEPDAHVPDARFRVGRGVPTAVEVELTNKGPARLRAIVDELTRSYAAILYVVDGAALRAALERAVDGLGARAEVVVVDLAAFALTPPA